jgi:hypothetical protein
MKFIKLTTNYNNVKETIYINPSFIGDIYGIPERKVYDKVEPRRTKIGCLTHNNGGFEVMESVEEIIKLIENI